MKIIDQILNFFYLKKYSSITEYFKNSFSGISIKIYLILAIILNILLWLTANYISTAIDKDLIALHYNVDFGINLFGEKKNIYALPLIGLVIIILNTVLFILLGKRKDLKFITQFLFIAAILANIFLLAGIFSIYLINVQ